MKKYGVAGEVIDMGIFYSICFCFRKTVLESVFGKIGNTCLCFQCGGASDTDFVLIISNYKKKTCLLYLRIFFFKITIFKTILI